MEKNLSLIDCIILLKCQGGVLSQLKEEIKDKIKNDKIFKNEVKLYIKKDYINKTEIALEIIYNNDPFGYPFHILKNEVVEKIRELRNKYKNGIITYKLFN